MNNLFWPAESHYNLSKSPMKKSSADRMELGPVAQEEASSEDIRALVLIPVRTVLEKLEA